MMFEQQFQKADEACALAQAIVDTVREPLVVLNHELQVVAASRSFYAMSSSKPGNTLGESLYELGDRVWDIPALRRLLGNIVSRQITMDQFEVVHDFPIVGRRTILLNARKGHYGVGTSTTILLGFEDITTERDLARRNQDLLREKDMLLKEFEHRMGNSLAIIASMISLNARMVDSEEARRHLHDAHDRVISFAAIQQSLHPSAPGGFVELGPHFAKLCAAISNSLIGENKGITIEARGAGRATRREAECLGLIVAELVINCLKHAFTGDTTNGLITVAYEVSATDWKLSVSDNGVGISSGTCRPGSGLGTSIINGLAKQLGAQVATVTGHPGTTVSITHTSVNCSAEAWPLRSVTNMSNVA